MNKNSGNFFPKKNFKTTSRSIAKSSFFTTADTMASMDNILSSTDKSSQNLSKSQLGSKMSTTAIQDCFKVAKPRTAG